VVSRESLPSFLPAALREKLDSAVLIVSPSVRGTTTLVCNASRIDFGDRAIDQEPFAVVVYPEGTSSGGVFVHHGEWLGRTSPPSAEFWQQVQGSGVGNYFLAHPPEGVTGGPLTSLPIGQKRAFDAVVARLTELKSDGGT
jgi:hypothetical protein